MSGQSMELDMQLPSFQAFRSGSHKRPRSPDSPFSLDPPLKRTHFAVETRYPSPIVAPADVPSMSLDYQPHHELVSQTHCLKLDSPEHGGHQELLPAPQAQHVYSLGSSTMGDMSTAGSPFTELSFTHQYPLSTAEPPLQTYSGIRIPQHLHYPTPPPEQLIPFTDLNSEPCDLQSFSHIPAVQTYLSSSGNYPPNNNPTLSKHRPRFTMGFRADCDKCQARVPGHWAHLD